MSELREGLPRISKSGGETQGVIKPWGDPALHGPDIKPEEGRRIFRKDMAEKQKRQRGTIAQYINHRQD